MKVPKLDIRTKNDILNEIQELAEVYTPEWNFDKKNPDMGSAIADIYAEMTADIINKYNKTAEKNMIEFFGRLGTSPLPSEPAYGYVQFEVSGNEWNVNGEYIKNGVKILTNSNENHSLNSIYTVTEPVYAVNSKIMDIYYENTYKDIIIKRFSSDDNSQQPENIFTFKDSGENLQSHVLYFSADECMNFFCKAKVEIIIETEESDKTVISRFMETIIERKQYGLYYSSNGRFCKVHSPQIKGNRITFIPQHEKLPKMLVINGIEKYWFKIVFNDISVAEKVYIKDIFTSTKAEKIKPDGVFNDIGELNPERFYPYDINPVPYSSIYFSSDSALGKSGAEITFEFKIDYIKNRINELSENEEINWKHIMKKSKIRRQKEYDVKIQSVVWEYYNGFGWVRLFKDDSYRDVFNSENDSSVVKIIFKCPNDICKVFLPSNENYAIRARLLSVENYMKYNGYYISPIISGSSFSYCYHKPEKAQYVIAENCMETRIYDRIQNDSSFKAALLRPNIGKGLYFGFSSPPEYSDIKILFVMNFIEKPKPMAIRWEYFSSDDWKELSSYDETNGLVKTGIVTLNLNKGFTSTPIFGKERYWIRARVIGGIIENNEIYIKKICINCTRVMNIENHDYEYFYIKEDDKKICHLRNGNVYKAEVMVNELSEFSEVKAEQLVNEKKAFPVYDDDGKIYQLWIKWNETNNLENSSPQERCYYIDREKSEVIFGNGFFGKTIPKSEGENVRISYTTGGGKSGNVDAGKLTVLDKSIGMISGITNPVRTFGGDDREKISNTIKRAAGGLRCFSRACTAFDYEYMAFEAERSIIKVKCLSNINKNGKKEFGAVTLAVLFREQENFHEISKKIRKHILSKCCGNFPVKKLFIVPPIKIKYNITALIYTEEYNMVSEIQNEIQKNIKNFFDPINGGIEHKGWEIGQIPTKIMIYNILDNALGVVRIESFYMGVCRENGDEITEIELNEIVLGGMAMPETGKLEIEIDVKMSQRN